ncbi:MAG: ATP-binding protein [Saprospiraceae bacterium]
MRQFFPILFFWSLTYVLNAQFKKDSSYSYQDLTYLLEIARANNDQKTLAEVYVKLADYEGDVFAEYEKSFEYYRRALEYFKITRDTFGVYETNHAIARRYTDAGFYDESVTLLLNLIQIYSDLNRPEKLAHLYFDLNKTYKAKGEGVQSIAYLTKAEELNSIVKDTTLMTNILFDKTTSFELALELDSALVTAFKIFTISSEFEDLDIVSKSLYHIGYINKLRRDYELAVKYLSKANELLPSKPYSLLRKMIYKELAETYALIDNPQLAYEFLNSYTLLNDSISFKNRLESFTNLALKYGSKDKQTSIELLKIEKQYAEEKNTEQRRTLYILGIGLIIVIISIYFIVKFYDQRITTTKIITEQKEEINNQRIRELESNYKMSSMRFVIEGQEIERERIAKDLHDSLGGLLSTIKLQFDHVRSKRSDLTELKEYNKAQHLLDTAVDEVRNISRNLQPGSLHNLGLTSAIKDLINRIEGEASPYVDFQYYMMPEKLDKMISLTVYRIIQELLSNTLKHAKADEILIQINTEADELVIQYEDDGIGFDQNNLKRKGMGLDNIKSRVNYLHGQITIDSENGQGISVLIRIKYL